MNPKAALSETSKNINSKVTITRYRAIFILIFLSASLLIQAQPKVPEVAQGCPIIHNINTFKNLPDVVIIQAASSDELEPSVHQFDELNYKTWERSNANSESLRYSALTQINKNNVNDLEVKFHFKSGVSPTNIQANPIVIDGKAIFPISPNQLVAIDSASGYLLWKINTALMPARRGLTYWPGDTTHASRVFFAAGNNLYAISPEDGSPIKNFGNNGKAGKGISFVAPVIAKGVIAYPSVHGPDGEAKVQGLDLITGKKIWETSLIKSLEANCLKKFSGQFSLSGANPWSGVSADQETGILFITTGDAQGISSSRPGNNDYANSVIAINIKSGEIIWSFQEIAHDLWDLDISGPPILATIPKNGINIDVVIAVTKSGNTIILDRKNGRPIFPWILKKTEVSNIINDPFMSPYFPYPSLPEPFSPQIITLKDLTNIGIKNHASALKIATNTNFTSTRPSLPSKEFPKETLILGVNGGAEWPGATIDPITFTLFVASNNIARLFPSMIEFYDFEGYPANKPPWGKLTAIDLISGKIKWSVPLGNDKNLEARGLKDIGMKNLCGPVVTASGLVICAGTTDKLLRIFDADSGKLLWDYQLPAYGSAPVSIYDAKGKQYILVPATGGNNGTLFNQDSSDSFIVFGLK